MDTANFLARVVAPGNYLAITFKAPGKGMGTRFFPRHDVAAAAGFLRWAARHGMDAYYALASYTLAQPDGTDAQGAIKFTGERTQANAQNLRAFWIDIDVKRPGDKKQAGSVYPDSRAAMSWFINTFLKQTALPPPNVMVNSGWGIHVYWVLEDPMAVAAWQPYADALKAALIQCAATLDVGLSSDAARILRPPQTSNQKDPANPRPVDVVQTRWSANDYPNALVLTPLTRFLQAPRALPTVGSGPATLGLAPAAAGGGSKLAAAAQSNMPALNRDYKFAAIALKCQQVRQSLAANGLGDEYPIWYLGHLSLAAFCTDGADYVHPISNGDPKYTAAETDRMVARLASERAAKRHGPPTCQHYETRRPAGCTGCPFAGKIKTPLVLGVDDGDLPPGYRRSNGYVQRRTIDKEGEPIWLNLLRGDVYEPTVDAEGSAHALTFTYELAGRTHTVTLDSTKLPTDTGRLIGLLASMGINVNRFEAPWVGDFVVAWINELRDRRVVRLDSAPAFGWSKSADGKYVGFGVGGIFYRADGRDEQVQTGDREVALMYRPHGKAADWTAACDFVIKDRPDLQTLVGASFGAPLMKFTGHSGVVVSVWSRGSAVGKSSAFTIGQTVWAGMNAMVTNAATYNHVRGKASAAKVMPIYWDEVKVTKDNAADAVQLLFELSQGQDKGRLNQDATLKRTGTWDTILVCAGNQPLMDHILAERGETDAAAARAFEFSIDRPQMPLDAIAQQRITRAADASGAAGAVYARWLAAHAAVVEERVIALSQALAKGLDAQNVERFHIAGMACILAGAQIAKQLGLAAFDLPALRDFLVSTFRDLRAARAQNVPVKNGVVDLTDVLSRFVSAYANQRLVTTCFNRGGRPDPIHKIIWVPEALGKQLVIHIGQREQAMRVDKPTFESWCRSNRCSSSDILTQMQRQWGATIYRGMLGAGTKFRGTAKGHIVDIPLVAAGLEDEYLDVPAGAMPVAKAAAALGLRGNQPKA